MKNYLIILAGLLAGLSSYAQNPFGSESRMFFSAGMVTPQYFSGVELTRAQELREQGLSYFQNEAGVRRNVGNYPGNSGFSLSIGYYIPIKPVNGLSLGFLVNSGQTGSSPLGDGYAEGYFFNFLNFGLGAQYYPFQKFNLYLKGEVGMGSVFTKNRFVNEASEQDFLHHFGIGLETGGGIGYTFSPFRNKAVALFGEAQFQYYSTRVEVSGVGNDAWQFGALHIAAGVQFSPSKLISK